MRHGLGQLKYRNRGKLYKGYWTKNDRNGNGIVIDSIHKTEFHGVFNHGKKDGLGVLIFQVEQ